MCRVSWRKTLTIAQDGTISNVLSEIPATQSIVDMTIYGPSALTGTVTVQVAPTDNPESGDWIALQKSGSDVTVPAVKATPVGGMFRALRLVSGSAEAALRTFPVIGQSEV